MKPIPVGTRVRLNDHGLSRIGGGASSWAEVEAARDMRVTRLENLNKGTSYPPIWEVEVDKPEINKYMLDTSMMEIIE